ncbi:MAG: hypothetical protein CSB47_02265 [Proteobacteria bacterium]|nr:MAG: hypothetical protein CSB47_02265 [Pseudomonadota bacterium]
MQTPEQQPAISLFQTLFLAFLTLVIYVFLQGSLLQYFAAERLSEFATQAELQTTVQSLLYDARVLSYVEIVSGTFATLFVILVVHLKNLSPTQYLGIAPFRSRDLINWLVVLIAFTLLLALVSWLISHNQTDFMQRIWDSADNVPLLLIGVVVFAPIFEETLFRGFIFSGIRQSYLGTGPAIAFSAASWAMIHTQYGAFDIFSIFILGIILSMARIASGSLLVPIILHGVFNLFAIFEMALFS